jgi:ATP-dependent Lhr-like helicase
VQGYRQEWLDEVTLSGELAWGRLWGGGRPAIRSTPVCLLPREELDVWLALAPAPVASRAEEPAEDGAGDDGAGDGAGDHAGPEESAAAVSSYADALLSCLEARGPAFTQDLERHSGLLPSHVEMGLAELVGRGLVTCDSWSGLRRLITPPSRRRGVLKRARFAPPGRWTRLRLVPNGAPAASFALAAENDAEFLARRLLERYGVVFRRILERERLPVRWRDLVRVYRLWELRGEVRGGRFVQRFAGEQYALPEAVDLLRRLRRSEKDSGAGACVSAADPLNLDGILTPEPRVPSQARRRVLVA